MIEANRAQLSPPLCAGELHEKNRKIFDAQRRERSCNDLYTCDIVNEDVVQVFNQSCE